MCVAEGGVMDKTLLEALSVALDEVYLQSDSAEAGTAASEPPARRGVRVENTVHHALIKHPVGLAVLAGQLGARFSPRVFTAAVLRPLSGVTLSLFSKGNVVLTGTRARVCGYGRLCHSRVDCIDRRAHQSGRVGGAA